MRKKKAPKGRRERIEDDWTRKEKEMQWKLEEMAREERRRNRRAEVRYAKIWMGGKWWRWDGDRERIVD